jgi:hypothetical protein
LNRVLARIGGLACAPVPSPQSTCASGKYSIAMEAGIALVAELTRVRQTPMKNGWLIEGSLLVRDALHGRVGCGETLGNSTGKLDRLTGLTA